MSSLLEVSEVLNDYGKFRVSWFDADRTIIVLEISSAWTWEEAFEILPLMAQHIERQPHGVYTVFYYHVSSANLLPRGSALTNLRRLVEMSPPNERMVLYVRQDTLTRQLITLLSKVYGLASILRKHHFVATWEEALQRIEADKAQAL